MKFDSIGFIGLGLIGGSIAKKLKELYPDSKIIAMAHSDRTVSEAYSMGIIENDHNLTIADFGNCDLIYLCAPVEHNIAYLEQLKPIIKDDCVITDVGSTKTKIHEKVIELDLESNFIGGHPMTGSEKTGLAYSDPLFLENTYYIITPTALTTSSNLQDYLNMVKAFGSISLILDYKKHDYATAAISHLPHMIAFSLTHMVKDLDDENETMRTIAAGSFRDMTRVAASSPAMWENIASSNQTSIVELMDNYLESFKKLRDDIANYNSENIYSYFSDAKEYRDSLNLPGNRIQNLVHEIYLDLKDESGEIAIIATILAFKNISIKNIGIINNREFTEGVLCIEFYDEHAKKMAIDLLIEHNYTIHLR